MTFTLRAIVALLTVAGSLALAGGAFPQAAQKTQAPKPSQAQMQADKACKAHAKGSLQHQQCLRQQLAKSKKAAGTAKAPMGTAKKPAERKV
jgi:hypothetical protein